VVVVAQGRSSALEGPGWLLQQTERMEQLRRVALEGCQNQMCLLGTLQQQTELMAVMLSS